MPKEWLRAKNGISPSNIVIFSAKSGSIFFCKYLSDKIKQINWKM